ncbi:thrombospondin type 3 repeat-containing protein [Zhongshania borealis]|uniref:Thrombospondin type 3 repeat-containing protein n=1 Tax=Zhongshania borealis TaxID=889488 RepID=A0ABP7WRH2_9GAMM
MDRRKKLGYSLVLVFLLSGGMTACGGDSSKSTIPKPNNPVAGIDVDEDGIDDSIDNCLSVSNPTQADTNNDGEGDACDVDDAPKIVANWEDTSWNEASWK